MGLLRSLSVATTFGYPSHNEPSLLHYLYIGTSGNPKGVLLEHPNVINYYQADNEVLYSLAMVLSMYFALLPALSLLGIGLKWLVIGRIRAGATNSGDGTISAFGWPISLS